MSIYILQLSTNRLFCIRILNKFLPAVSLSGKSTIPKYLLDVGDLSISIYSNFSKLNNSAFLRIDTNVSY